MTTYTPVTTSSETVGDLRASTQFAPCHLWLVATRQECKSTLTFALGPYGQLLERCTNPRCAGFQEHPIVTPPITREPATPHKRNASKSPRRGPQGNASPRPRSVSTI